MAEETTTPTADGQQQVQFVVDHRDAKISYANGYIFSQTPEELVLDLGLQTVVPNPQQQNQPQVMLKVSERVVLSYATAKRLAMSLQQLIKRHEQQFGEINVQPGQRR